MMRVLVRALLACSLAAIAGGCVLAAQLGLTSLTETIYDQQGVQINAPAPTPVVYRTDGSPIPLQRLWEKRPALIVNGSYTCPVARLNNPGLGKLQQRYRNRLDVVVLYVYEPHPKGDPSPYTGKEWVTFSNILSGILYRQPRSLPDRLLLAGKFEQHIEGAVPVLVDGMENHYWQAVGGGPNTALLVNPAGKVVAKQGWYHQKNMQALLDNYFGMPQAEKEAPLVLKRGPRDI